MRAAVVLVLLLLCTSSSTFAARRALVVGNAKYADADLVLDTPLDDAGEVASRLANLGFAVTPKENLTLEETTKAIEAFASSVAPGDTALFYYAGHAIQVDGQNYLWPTDTHLPPVSEVADHFVPLSSLYSRLRRTGAGTTVIILDACRNNPYYSRLAGGPDWIPGLAPPSGAPDVSLIAYATAPGMLAEDSVDGQTRKHSPFTRALLASMSATGIPIETVFRSVTTLVKTMTEGRQTPWTHSSLTEPFYFRPPVTIRATIHSADDDALILLDGSEVLSFNASPNIAKSINLHGGDNELLVKVYNQKSFTGGLEIFGGHQPEGWNYHVSVQRADGSPLIEDLRDGEDVPEKDGAHQGHMFTVAKVLIHVDDDSGIMTVATIDRAAWKRN